MPSIHDDLDRFDSLRVLWGDLFRVLQQYDSLIAIQAATIIRDGGTRDFLLVSYACSGANEGAGSQELLEGRLVLLSRGGKRYETASTGMWSSRRRSLTGAWNTRSGSEPLPRVLHDNWDPFHRMIAAMLPVDSGEIRAFELTADGVAAISEGGPIDMRIETSGLRADLHLKETGTKPLKDFYSATRGLRIGDPLVLPPASGCFVGETLVDTPDGPRSIKSLRPGDRVLTGIEARSARKVLALHQHTASWVIDLDLDGVNLRTTPNHRLLTQQGYMRAGNLSVGTRLRRLDGSEAEVRSIRARTGEWSVYNLVVEDHFSFTVHGVRAHSFSTMPYFQCLWWRLRIWIGGPMPSATEEPS